MYDLIDLGKPTCLDLPMTPTANHIYGQTKFGRRFLKPEAINYKNNIRNILKYGNYPKFFSYIRIEGVIFFPKDLRSYKSDIDNRIKFLYDCLSKNQSDRDDNWIIENDNLIVSKRWDKVFNESNKYPQGRIFVRIFETNQLKDTNYLF